MSFIKNIEKSVYLIVLILLVNGTNGIGCPKVPPFPKEPDYDPDLIAGTGVNFKIITDANTPPPTDGQSGVDPVLLKTGEFLLTRKDAMLEGCGIDFPITRTYRSRPSPINRHTIKDVRCNK